MRSAWQRAAKRVFPLCALALAFGFVGVGAAVSHAVWFHLPSGVAAQDYVSVGRRAALSGRVQGIAATHVAEIGEMLPNVQWLTVERLYDMEIDVGTNDASSKHRLWSEGVGGGFFESLGVAAADGTLTAPPNTAAAVLGYDAWQRLFPQTNVASATLTIAGEGALSVVGVAPPRFRGLLGEPAELWILNPQHLPSNAAKGEYERRIDAATPDRYLFGVLDSNTNVAQARALLSDMDLSSPSSVGTAMTVTEDDRIEVTPGLEFHPDMRQEVLSRTRWLVAIVACLLVLTFAALVDLLLGDQQARKEERNIQVAVGATPAQMFRHILAENGTFALLMALLAGATGVYVGKTLMAVQPFAAWLVEIPPTSIALGCAFGAGALVLAFAIAASYAARSVHVASRSSSAAQHPHRLFVTRWLMMFAATASLVLIASVAERYWREAGTAFTFAGEDALLVQVWSDQGSPATEVVRETIDALPQVRRSARMDLLPLVQPLSRHNRVRLVSDRPLDGSVLYSGVKPAYFETLGVPVIAGRLHGDAGEAVISKSLAKRIAHDDVAATLGQAIRTQHDDTMQEDSERLATIVGVVEDIAYGHYLDGERAVVYGDLEPRPWDQRWVVAHEGDAAALLNALRDARAFQGYEVVEIGTPGSLFRTQFMAQRSVEILLAGAGALVLVLGLAGIAGNQVRQLTDDRRTIGISLAVGATRRSLAARYMTDMLADVAIAAALPCATLAAMGVVFPNAMSGVTTMLAMDLLLPALGLIVLVCSATVCLAVRHSASESPLALMKTT